MGSVSPTGKEQAMGRSNIVNYRCLVHAKLYVIVKISHSVRPSKTKRTTCIEGTPDSSLSCHSDTMGILLPIFSYMLSPVCLSVVGNARAPYSGGSNFRQYFYGIWYPSHPLTSTENFMEIVPGEPLRRGSSTQEG